MGTDNKQEHQSTVCKNKGERKHHQCRSGIETDIIFFNIKEEQSTGFPYSTKYAIIRKRGESKDPQDSSL